MKHILAKIICEHTHCNYIKVSDQSHLHQGHKGTSKVGNSHFTVVVVADTFEGQSLIQRHRYINQCCKPFFDDGGHALALHLFTQTEWEKKHGK